MIDGYTEVGRVANTLLRWWWILALGILIGGAIGYNITQRQARVYEATATVMVGDFIRSPEISRDDILVREAIAQTYAELATRQPVLDGAVKALSLDISWQMLKNDVYVDIVTNTQLIEVVAEANTPQNAELIVGEIVNQLLLLSTSQEDTESTQSFLQREIESLQLRIESGRNKLLVLQSELTSRPPQDQLDALNIEIDILEKSISDWEGTYSRLLVLLKPNVSRNNLTIVEEAHANPEPIYPRPLLNLIISAGVGMVLALGIIFLINLISQFDDKVKSAKAIERITGMNHLGSIGKMAGEKYEGKLIVAHEPQSDIAEAYRMIGRNIEFVTKDKPVKSLLVTSPGRDEGKSITVSNLGVAMAQDGHKTIIVDANLRNSVQHLIFDISNDVGLTDLFTTSAIKPKEQLKDTGIENLQVLTSGAMPMPQDTIGLLNPKKMKQILSDLTKGSNVIILDVPSIATTDGATLSSLVDGVILAIDFDRTTKASVEKSIARLNLAGGRLLGGILNRTHP